MIKGKKSKKSATRSPEEVPVGALTLTARSSYARTGQTLRRRSSLFKRSRRRSSVVQLGGVQSLDDMVYRHSGNTIIANVYEQVQQLGRDASNRQIEPYSCMVSSTQQYSEGRRITRRGSTITAQCPLISAASHRWQGTWRPVNQSAAFGLACTQALYQLVKCRSVRVFIQSTIAEHRSLVYLDSGDMQWTNAHVGRGIVGRLLSDKGPKMSTTSVLLPAEDMSVHYDPEVDLPRASGRTHSNMFSLPLVLGDKGGSCRLQALVQVQRDEFNQEECNCLECFAGVAVAPMLYRWLEDSSMYLGQSALVLEQIGGKGLDLRTQVQLGLESIRMMLEADIVSLYHVDFHSDSLMHYASATTGQLFGKVKMKQCVPIQGQSALVTALRDKRLVLSSPNGKSNFDSSIDAPVGGSIDYDTAHVAAHPFYSIDRVVVGVILCSKRESDLEQLPEFTSYQFTVIRILLCFLCNMLLLMNLADLSKFQKACLTQQAKLGRTMISVRNQLWSAAAAPQWISSVEQGFRAVKAENWRDVHPTLQIVRQVGVSELEMLWRLQQALGVKAVVLWLKMTPTVLGEEVQLYQAHLCLTENPYEEPIEDLLLQRSESSASSKGDVVRCHLGQGLVGNCASTTTMSNIVIHAKKNGELSANASAAGKALDLQVDIPDLLPPQSMSCMCYPLACCDPTDPDSYQGKGSNRYSKGKVASHCVGVVQLLAQYSLLGRVTTFSQSDVSFVQTWGQLLFQRVLSDVDAFTRQGTGKLG